MNTPEVVDHLDPNEIFVFGSNLAGRHGAGAALLARVKYGAVTGQPGGLMGQSYGIPTKGKDLEVLSLKEIHLRILWFLEFAERKPYLRFLVTQIGCGLAGYKPKDIAPLFSMKVTGNVILPKSFTDIHNPY